MNPPHNDLREVLMQTGHTRGLLILDALCRHNVNPLEPLCVADVMGILSDTSEYIIRSGLADQTLFRQEKQSTGKPGRPTIYYIMPDPEALRDRFVPVDKRVFDFADQLPDWAYYNQRDYRLAYLQTMILRRQEMFVNKNQDWEGFTCPLMYMADMLGVSRNTIRAYKRVLKVASAPQFNQERVTEKTLRSIPIQGKQGKEYLAAGNMLEVMEGKGRKAPLMREIAERWIACGLTVWRVIHLASKIQIPPNSVLYWGRGRYSDSWEKLVMRPEFSYAEAA